MPIAVARVALLSPDEAWLEGIRVDPRVRGMDVATDLQVAELHWAAEHGARVVRYATGSGNEASHRLGARHGFELLVALHTWSWHDPDAPEDGEEDDESGFDAVARARASETRRQALDRLAQRGLVADRDAADELWRRVNDDATFVAAHRLYESRPWAMAELTEQRFARHCGGGEVVVVDKAEAGWALAVFEREAQPSEDLSFHLSLLVGAGAAALSLVNVIREAVGESIRFRLPEPDPPLVRDHAGALLAWGFRAREWTLHILGRLLDEQHPPPALPPHVDLRAGIG
ncbi:MAG: GNAT family N-acetyltransferase [Chloroflexota bacterium]|nr:GNAT family N-acetyltransferase [Chloroflexota bacterium]